MNAARRCRPQHGRRRYRRARRPSAAGRATNGCRTAARQAPPENPGVEDRECIRRHRCPVGDPGVHAICRFPGASPVGQPTIDIHGMPHCSSPSAAAGSGRPYRHDPVPGAKKAPASTTRGRCSGPRRVVPDASKCPPVIGAVECRLSRGSHEELRSVRKPAGFGRWRTSPDGHLVRHPAPKSGPIHLFFLACLLTPAGMCPQKCPHDAPARRRFRPNRMAPCSGDLHP